MAASQKPKRGTPRDPVEPMGRRIKALREAEGWSQATLAGKVGCSDPTIARIEKGYTTSRIHIEEIANIFKLDVSTLIRKDFNGKLTGGGREQATGPRVMVQLVFRDEDAWRAFEPKLQTLVPDHVVIVKWKGSFRVRVEMSPEDAQRLLAAVEAGEFNEAGLEAAILEELNVDHNNNPKDNFKGENYNKFICIVSLILFSCFSGATFLATQMALTVSGPLFCTGIQFAIGFAVAAAVSTLIDRSEATLHHLGVVPGMTRREVALGLSSVEFAYGVASGILLALIFVLRAYGLEEIPSSKSAFITALATPLALLVELCLLPLRPLPFYPKRWLIRASAGLATAIVGVIIAAGFNAGSIRFSRGETLTLLSAAVLTILWVAPRPARVVYWWRVDALSGVVAAIVSFGAMTVVRETLPAISWRLVMLVGGSGLIYASIKPMLVLALRHPSYRLVWSWILASWPLWAVGFGYIAGERLNALTVTGVSLIVASHIIAQNATAYRLSGSLTAASDRDTSPTEVPTFKR